MHILFTFLFLLHFYLFSFLYSFTLFPFSPLFNILFLQIALWSWRNKLHSRPKYGFQGASTSEDIGIGMKLFMMIMMANDIRRIWGPRFPDICHSWGKPPKKPQPGKLTLPGIEPGPAGWEVMMLPLDYSGGQGTNYYQIYSYVWFPHYFYKLIKLHFFKNNNFRNFLRRHIAITMEFEVSLK